MRISSICLLTILLLSGILLPSNSKADEQQIKCIATAIHYEARGSTLQDKMGVANVIMNRVKDRRFPKTPCSVVMQRNQFSWTSGNWSYKSKYEELARKAFTGQLVDITNNSLYFHTTKVNPRWSRNKKKTRIGSHYYMR